MTEVLRAAAEHAGAAFVEIYHNCPIFNDEAYAVLTDKDIKDAHQIRLEHDQPIRFGAERERGVAQRPDGSMAIVDVADVGEDALLVHDAHCADPSRAFALAHLSQKVSEPTPIGVFRTVERPVYGERSQEELRGAHAGHRPRRARSVAARRSQLDRQLAFSPADAPHREEHAMRGAAVQLEPAIRDVAANLTAAERLAAEAARAGAEWIVLPEFFSDSDAFQPPLVRRATLALDAA